jgi:WS/DGAT/MGAT family acyltransferase
MTVAGLCELCADLDGLTALIRATGSHRDALEPLRTRTVAHAAAGDLDEVVGPLGDHAGQGDGRPRPRRVWRMRAADAFFSHVERPGLPQEVGVVLELDPLPGGEQVTVAEVAAAFQPRVAGLPTARRVLSRHPLGWRLDPDVPVRDRIGEVTLPEEATESDLWHTVSALWGQPLPADEPGWRMVLVRAPHLGRSLFGVKLHHSHGDGISALGLLDRLLDASDEDPLRERRPGRALSATGHPLRRLRRLVRGTAALASRGTAPRHPLNQQGTPGAPLLLSVTLPWPQLRRLADELDARPHELVVALLAHACALLLRERGLVTPGEPLRAMIPVAMRTPRLDRIFGNWTGSLALDLPTTSMTVAERVAVVRREMRERAEQGEAHAAAAVMTLAGRLPSHLHRWFARAVYSRRFFNTIVSYMPAARGPRWVAGARVRSFSPVLPLAEGVPLTVGIIVADGDASFGFLVDERLGIDRAAVQEAVAKAFTEAGGDLSTTAAEEG